MICFKFKRHNIAYVLHEIKAFLLLIISGNQKAGHVTIYFDTALLASNPPHRYKKEKRPNEET